RRPGTRSRARSAARSAPAPTRAGPAALAPRTRSRARRPRGRPSGRSSRRFLLSCARGLAADQNAELLVGRAVAELAEALAFAPPGQPALDEALDRVVELLRRDPPEHRPGDPRVRAEPAAQEDVERLAALAGLVAQRGALEAEISDPVLGAGVRAAVQVEPETGDVVAEALLEPLHQSVEA